MDESRAELLLAQYRERVQEVAQLLRDVEECGDAEDCGGCQVIEAAMRRLMSIETLSDRSVSLRTALEDDWRTPEDLAALPDGSVVLNRYGTALQRDDGDGWEDRVWWQSGHDQPFSPAYLVDHQGPGRIIYTPETIGACAT
jgi:hypothetical protein